MTWDVKLWNVGKVIVDVGVQSTVSLVQGACSFSAVLGGAGIAFSCVVDEQLKTPYYGMISAPGAITITLRLSHSNFSFSESIPFHHYFKKEGQQLYDAKDYFSSQQILFFSICLVAVSTMLKTFISYYKTWLEYQDDEQHYKKKHSMAALCAPSLNEYHFAAGADAFHTLTLAALSCSLVGGVFSCSYVHNQTQQFTYPSKGMSLLNSIYYHGPVVSTLLPIDFLLQYNVSINLPLPHINCTLLIQEVAHTATQANVTYGAGLFFEAKNNPAFPVLAPAVISASSYTMSRFFAKKVEEKRDERVCNTINSAYNLLENGFN